MKGTPASCTTPCTDGMVVSTRTEQVQQLRRGVMELYLSDHPIDCAGCERGAAARCRSLAHDVGLAEVRYGLGGASHLAEAADESNPYFAYDPKACIVCSRCVRACSEVQGTFALTVSGRGFDSRITRRRHRLPVVGVRLVRRVRAGLPDRRPHREVGRRARDAVAHGAHDVRLLRGRLLVQGRGAGVRRRDAGRADGAVEGRRRQRGPLVRQGPLRLRLRLAPRPAAGADGPRLDRRRVAGRVVGGGDRPGGVRVPRACARSTASARSAASRRRGAPTRRSTSSRRWCGRRSATTTSTPARGSATPPPATA